MTINNKEDARKRTQMLAELRKQHSEQVKQAQELLKEQQAVRKKLQGALRNGPRSVPQLAEATAIPAHQVLWYVATMKKYGLVEEAGLDDDEEYYLYSLSKGSEL
jgi:predicted Rossmann fold nucleotide-binding protein DprA/Smf involved in DNA uptake